MKHILYIILAVCLAAFAISGCSDSSDEPEPTTTATAISPTETAQPNPTPTPDSTPPPDSTPTIIPTAEPTVASSPEPVNIDFESGCFNWPDDEFGPTNWAELNTAFTPGDIAPDFALKDTDGQTHSLSSLLETKPVLMVFGAFT